MDTLGISLGIGACALLAYHLLKVRRFKERYRRNADKTFQEAVVEADNPRYSFHGSTAQCMKEQEQVEQMRGVLLAYTLTRVAKNASGEYFWFSFHTRAQALLKTKYVAPKTENVPQITNG
jgi:hypothetical protein